MPQQSVGMQQVQPAAAPIAPLPIVVDPVVVPQQRVGMLPIVAQPPQIRVIPLLPPGLDLAPPQQQVEQTPHVRTSGRITTRTPLFSYTGAVVPIFGVQIDAINVQNGTTASTIVPNYAAMANAIAAVEDVANSNNYFAHVLTMIDAPNVSNMTKTSKYGRPLLKIIPSVIIANNNICDETALDKPISSNRTGGGRTKVRTAISTLVNAGKGLFLSKKQPLNIDDVICLIQHEKTRYMSEEEAYATNSNRIMEGPPSTHNKGRYFIGKETSYGAYINDPLDETKYNARFRWNNNKQQWEVVATKEINYLDEIFISYGHRYWAHFQHLLSDKTQLFERWPVLQEALPSHPKAQLPQQSKSQAKHNLALGVVRNLDATTISADKYTDGHSRCYVQHRHVWQTANT